MTERLHDRLQRALAVGQITPLQMALADWGRRHGAHPRVAEVLAVCARDVADGNSCSRLDNLMQVSLPTVPIASAEKLHKLLKESELVRSAADALDAGQARPLILDGEHIYLHRYWQYEIRLAARLNSLLATPPREVDPAPLLPEAGLFDYSWLQDGETHWQAVAAGVAHRHRLTIISGGPGTGKTYSVLRLMVLLIDAALSTQQPVPRICLAAPTGKAAARMVDSVTAGISAMDPVPSAAAHIPREATTLHRLLGSGSRGTRPRHHATNPLLADVVIVDEASMVDLPLMTKLVEALSAEARLILLGDRYQLTSVESGSVLAELCDAAGVNSFSEEQQQALSPLLGKKGATGEAAISDHVVTLQTSHRFAADSRIGRLASAINVGKADAAIAILGEDAAEIDWNQATSNHWLDQLLKRSTAHALALHQCDNPEAALQLLDDQVLLCALRRGPQGADTLNQRITTSLLRELRQPVDTPWYPGRPVMITRNDYRQELFNGDIGICLADGAGQLRVWFRSADGLRACHPGSLPEHSTAYALSVHKSQGSEFRSVLLVLPDRDSPVLSRQLLYTGITRARDSISLYATEEQLRNAIQRKVRRESGLMKRLTS